MDSDAEAGSSVEALGSFDEESCRYFLRQVGARVVPYYPFSMGMEEVYSLILENYGHAGLSDATGVLQDLLEDESSSTGFGDDGDIWRSWRYSWKHRNHDVMNPFIPRIGNFVLQPPTPRSIRSLKVENFLRAKETQTGRSVGLTNDNMHASSSDKGSSSRGKTLSHQRCRLMLPTIGESQCTEEEEPQEHTKRRYSSSSSGEDSQQDFEEVPSSMIANELDPSLLITFEMLDPPCPTGDQALSLRGGHTQMLTLRQVRETSVLDQKLDSVDKKKNHDDDSEKEHTPQAILSKADRDPDSRYEYVAIKTARRYSVNTSMPSNNSAERRSRSNSMSQCDRDQENKTKMSKLWRRSENFAAEEYEKPKLKQIANREVRFINGKIFPPRMGVPELHGRRNSRDKIMDVIGNGRSLIRHSWITNLQKQELPSSLLQRARSVVRPETKGKGRDNLSRSQRSALEEERQLRSKMPRSRKSTARGVLDQNFSFPKKDLNLSLDGVGETSPSRAHSPVNLNKSLPLSPIDIVQSMPSTIEQTSLKRVESNKSSQKIEKYSKMYWPEACGKTDFRALTHDLLNGGMKIEPIFSNNQDIESELDPKKFDLQEPEEVPCSPMTFSSMAKLNPFTDDPVPLSPVTICRPRAYSATNASAAQIFLPDPEIHPLENSVAAQQTKSKMDSSFERTEAHPVPEHPRGRKQHADNNDPRARRQSPSPVRGTDRGQALTSNRQTKRSRSPVKRFLGIGKSSSMKNIQAQPALVKERPATENNKMSSLKNWGNKLRYGFLTADQEQLENEENMEQHMEETLAHQRSALPISLAPAYQARVQSNIELIITLTANRYLLNESKAGRISEDTINKVQRGWIARGLPGIKEFLYDQATQRSLILMNLSSVHLYGQCEKDPLALNATLHSWALIAKDMVARVFCFPDSSIQKHLHDTQRTIEMLGAPSYIAIALQDLQLKVLAKINQIQKEKFDFKSGTPSNGNRTSGSSKDTVFHKRNTSEGSWPEGWTGVTDNFEALNFEVSPIAHHRARKATGAEGAIMQGRNPRG